MRVIKSWHNGPILNNPISQHFHTYNSMAVPPFFPLLVTVGNAIVFPAQCSSVIGSFHCLECFMGNEEKIGTKKNESSGFTKNGFHLLQTFLFGVSSTILELSQDVAACCNLHSLSLSYTLFGADRSF